MFQREMSCKIYRGYFFHQRLEALFFFSFWLVFCIEIHICCARKVASCNWSCDRERENIMSSLIEILHSMFLHKLFRASSENDIKQKEGGSCNLQS